MIYQVTLGRSDWSIRVPVEPNCLEEWIRRCIAEGWRVLGVEIETAE